MLTLTRPAITDREAAIWPGLSKTSASDSDYDDLLAEPCTIYEAGADQPSLIYTTLPGLDTSALAEALLQAKPRHVHARAGGLPSRSTTFGYRPRLPIRKFEYCGKFMFNEQHPATYEWLRALAQECSSIFATYRPDVQAVQMHEIGRTILPEYRLGPGAVYTSGIINYDNPLAYHRDQGNIRGAWNAMIVLRRDVEGGRLVVPAWRTAFEVADGSLMLFQAQSTTHGVTPVIRRTRQSYRISVVFYALAALQHCLCHEEELAYARRRRSEREHRRAGIISERQP